MNKLLFADSAGPAWQKVYNNTHYALAALLPASLVSPQDGAIAKVADLGLAATITAHNHVALNYGERRNLPAVGRQCRRRWWWWAGARASFNATLETGGVETGGVRIGRRGVFWQVWEHCMPEGRRWCASRGPPCGPCSCYGGWREGSPTTPSSLLHPAPSQMPAVLCLPIFLTCLHRRTSFSTLTLLLQ